MAQGPLGGPRPFSKQSVGINVTLTDKTGQPEDTAQTLFNYLTTSFDQVVVGHGTAPSINRIQCFATTNEDYMLLTNFVRQLDNDDIEIKTFEMSTDTSGEAISKEFDQVIST
jgi:hypothetical protein